MKFILAGKNSIAVDVLEFLIEIGYEVSVVLNRKEDFKNGFQKSLGFYAKLLGVPILSLEETYTYNDAIFLSLEYDRIIKPNLFNTNQLFNIHFSLLPAYKGMYTSVLPILNGEAISGVTLHQIDFGIDTGDIIDQKNFKIKKKDTARDLYLNYIKYGTELVIENIPKLINKTYKLTRQSVVNSTYFGKKEIDYSCLKVDYKQTAFQIRNQLRAFSFREYQLPKFKNHEITSWKISKKKSTLKAGTLVKKIENKFIVSAIDFDIILRIDPYKELWETCRCNDYEKLKIILQNRDLNLEIKTNEGWTALIIAVYNGSFECILQLIDAGANVNAHNYNFTTVLMYAKTNAIKTNERRIIDKLIDSGANIFSKDVFGKTVIDWVKKEDNELHCYFKSKL